MACDYPYARGDLLHERNTYYYTPYHGRQFLDAWRAARNDVLANLGVLAAAGGVAWTGSHWPDLAVGVVIAGLILQSSFGIFKDARLELGTGRAANEQ